ncbi:homoserine kinase [Nitratidesulfovibrio sp. SRB-5]|uniref:homoserine kinase n=1 Tax=Nitratidesulfovibrio sp. SRB-5 TaxID=2872636 RepID=UPI001026B4E8|nr:homoserine kinase [Nitratidesulfovibrio sp. SRB-5]MBZ2173581.1 shikimate kinase [Nitratidesulfovibrio sp. SRB-5]RXF78279.1 shikimate kinase [Desulfovibrio sp. DS-1]
MTTPDPLLALDPARIAPDGCVSIIGMAGAGKTTVGRELALQLGWAHVDTDNLIEATYGTRLQAVADSMDKESFLDVEAGVIRRIGARRTVLSTGGSVVYRHEAMAHLAALGPLVYLDVSLPLILERIAMNPDRGLAIAPGQTIEDLYNERIALYRRYATFTVAADALSPGGCAERIVAWLTGGEA